MTTYSTTFNAAVVVVGQDGYTFLINATQSNEILNNGYGSQGSFDQTLQNFWGITASTIYQLNVIQSSISTSPNPWNIVAIAVAEQSTVLYSLATAADATILYVMDTTLFQWNFIGCISEFAIVPYSTAILDISESYLTFLAHPSAGGKVTLLTLDVSDGSIVYQVVVADTLVLLQSV